jgi:hypothetical protein
MDGAPLALGVSGTTDGVPFFKDMHRSGWPSTLCCASLPGALAQNAINIHLHSLTSSEYFERDGTRVVREPHSLQIVMNLVARDLESLYEEGTLVNLNDQEERVRCYLKLLFYNGDLPGLGKASNFVHAGRWFCHWCKTPGVHRASCQKVCCFDTIKQWLPDPHPLRAGELLGRPAMRTHAQVTTH